MSADGASEPIDLFSWRASTDTPQAVSRRRTTTHGLHKDVRIAVRGNEFRSADKGTVIDVRRRQDGTDVVSYRSDRNGGAYVVELERVRIVRLPRYRKAVDVPDEPA
jgi:hypothetical protein